jgi:arginine N-succinyltransferase
LQISKEQLSERVEHSDFAFHRKTEKPSGEPYVFVMEDTLNQSLVGLSCIFSKTGGFEPFYSYRRVRDSHYCDLLNKIQHVESLHLEKIHDGPTEIGSLFLSPDYRGQGRGRLLSLVRFAFMAMHPNRFATEVIAEMRGVMDEDGRCPFWEAIGRHFFDMDFPQADTLSTVNKKFIEDLMPRYPIYLNLLPAGVQQTLGQVHQNTKPALAMLEAEGFQKIDMLDIFDGGPVVQCKRDAIRAVKRTRVSQIKEIVPELMGPMRIIAVGNDGFRAVLGVLVEQPEGCSLTPAAAQLLQVRPGDVIHWLDLHAPQRS